MRVRCALILVLLLASALVFLSGCEQLINVSGSWEGTFFASDYPSVTHTLKLALTQHGTSLSGQVTVVIWFIVPFTFTGEITQGTVIGRAISIEAPAVGINLSGTYDAGQMSGTGTHVDDAITWSVHRT